MKLRIFLCLFLPVCTHALAVDEDAFDTTMNRWVMPFFALQNVKTMETGNDVSIAYKVFKQPLPNSHAIVIASGRTESLMKYQELVFDLFRMGYSVYIYDHRGQGLSTRLLKDREKGHVEKFTDYVEDFGRFINEVVRANRHAKVFVLAHSMGGAIVARSLLMNAALVDKAILSSPMLRLTTKPYPNWLAFSMVSGQVLAGRGENYVMGQGPYQPDRENTATHSTKRYRFAQKLLKEDPKLRLGGPTNSWLYYALRNQNIMRWRMAKVHTEIQIWGASEDQVVDSRPLAELCKKASACKFRGFNNSYHEILGLVRHDEVDL